VRVPTLGDHTKNDEAVVPGEPVFAAPMDSSGKHMRWLCHLFIACLRGLDARDEAAEWLLRFVLAAITSRGIMSTIWLEGRLNPGQLCWSGSDGDILVMV
jgi:hypothetical protein